MNFKNIPNELKENGYFCNWKREVKKNGRTTKVPYNSITGGKAQSNNPNTFTSFEKAVTATESEKYSGIGIGIFNDLCAIDIDHCVQNRILSNMAQDIINMMNTYTEFSPSGEGVRILFTAKNFSYDTDSYYINNQKIGLEIYVAGATNKYVTVTGNVMPVGEYGNRTTELQNVLDKYMKRERPMQDKTQNSVSSLSNYINVGGLNDNEVLGKASLAKNGFKFNSLYNGDITLYNSHSEADLALCNMLAFWCGCDIEQMDRLFRRSALYREKWDRKQSGYTYGHHTLKIAIDNCNNVYNSKQSSGVTTIKLKPQDFSDIGQTEAFVKKYGEIFRYSRATKYLFYNGEIWTESEIKVQKLAQDFTKQQLGEALVNLSNACKSQAKAIEKGDKQAINETEILVEKAKGYHKFILSRRNTQKISAMLKEAQPMVEIDVDNLDQNGLIMNTPSGIVDLRTSKISQHKPADYCTKITAVSPTDEGAKLFEDFLKVITCGDESLKTYLQLIAGMFAVGKVYCENLVIAYGDGRNGKSTFFNLLARVMGDYSGNLSSETLTSNCRKNKSPEYAQLRGKRLVIAAELEEGMQLNTAIVKKLCSTDPIFAEKKYKDPFSFIPSHTVVLYTNHLPYVEAADNGTWRRLIVVPFNAVIDGKNDIKNYCDYLFKNSGGAVLSWIIKGAEKFISSEHKIEPPVCVSVAINNYRNDNNWVNSYITDRCELDKTYKQEAGKLYQDYRDYCVQMDERYIRSAHEFKKALEDSGYTWGRTNKNRFHFGLRLLS